MFRAKLGLVPFKEGHCHGGMTIQDIFRVPSGVCIYLPGYVYIPFLEIGYVKGMYLIKRYVKLPSQLFFLAN